MTKKDYVLIAKVVASITDEPTRASVAEAFVKVLAPGNPLFRRLDFQIACKVPVTFG